MSDGLDRLDRPRVSDARFGGSPKVLANTSVEAGLGGAAGAGAGGEQLGFSFLQLPGGNTSRAENGGDKDCQ